MNLKRFGTNILLGTVWSFKKMSTQDIKCMKESNICALGQEGSSPINVTQLTSYRSLRHSVCVGYFVSVLCLS